MNFTSKKDLKKHIDRMSAEMAQVIIPAAVYANAFSIPEAQDALDKLTALQRQADSALSVHFDKKPKDFANPHDYRLARNAFFKKVYAEAHDKFHEGAEEILNSMKLG